MPKPMVISFVDGKTESSFHRASVEQPSFHGGKELNTFSRLNNTGIYEETQGNPIPRDGMNALSVLKELKSHLSEFKKDEVALVVKNDRGKVLHEYNAAEAKAFIDKQVKKELSHEHAVKELTGIIKSYAKSDGGIDGWELGDINKFAKEHGLKLKLSDVAGNKDSVAIIDSKSSKELVKVKDINLKSTEIYERG